MLGSGRGGLLWPRLMTGMLGGRGEDDEGCEGRTGQVGEVLFETGSRGGGEERVLHSCGFTTSVSMTEGCVSLCPLVSCASVDTCSCCVSSVGAGLGSDRALACVWGGLCPTADL